MTFNTMNMKNNIISILLITIILLCALVMLTGCGKNKLGKIIIETGVATATDAETKYYIENDDVIEFDHIEDKSKRKSGELGGICTKYYYFKGLKEGSTKIKFEILDIKGNVSREQNYEVKVDNKLNVTIIE